LANPYGFEAALVTQSQNASAKLALTVDEFYVNHFSSSLKSTLKWNKLEDTVFSPSRDAFCFFGAAFYTRMLMKIVDNLIPTGIMNYLIEVHYTRKWKFAKVGKAPQVLTLDDLAFGFNIWLGCCLLSLFGHVAEHLVRFVTKPKKLKFAKVHPIDDKDDEEVEFTLKPELLKKIRIKMDLEEIVLGEKIECEELEDTKN